MFRISKKKIAKEVEETLKTVRVETYLPSTIKRVSSLIPENAEIIDQYRAGYNGLSTVTIYLDPETEMYYYHVEEPPVSSVVENLYNQVRERLQTIEITMIEDVADKETLYERYILQALTELGFDEAYYKYPELRYYVIRDIVGWRIIDVPMRDPRVEEVDYSSLPGNARVVINHDRVYATWVESNINLSEQELNDLIEFLAFKCNKMISVSHPLLEARTPEGYRLAANLKEVGRSPGFTIRKFPSTPRSLTKIIANKTLTPLMGAYLWTLVENQRFIMIIGGMASGKTTLLQSILSVVPRDKKIVTIEDVPELRLEHPHWQALYTRKSIFGSEQDVTLIDLARYSLRTRAQYIVIGEVRDREIQTLVQMAASGHGSLCTFHAEDPRTLFLRLISPPLSVQPSFMIAIADVVLQARVWVKSLGRFERRTMRIWEITGLKETTMEGDIPVKYRTIFKWDAETDTHEPSSIDEVIERSVHLKRIAKSNYGDNWYEKLYAELEMKTEILKQLVEEKVFDYKEVTERIYQASLRIRKTLLR